MAAYIKTLQDASHANIIYPRTKAVAVFRDDENTTPVEETLVTLETQMESALRDINNINSNINTTNANFSSHAGDSNIHITSAERIAWNSLDSKANGYVNTHNVDTTAHEDIRSELINAKSSTIEYINTQINTHTHSWNDLEDKPFGEAVSMTTIFSGNIDMIGENIGDVSVTTGHIDLGLTDIPEEVVITVNGISTNVKLDEDGFYYGEQWINVGRYQDTGLSFHHGSNKAYTIENILIEAIVESINTIDPKYLPDTVATKIYVGEQIAAIPTPDVSGQIETHNVDGIAHPDIRALIEALTPRITTVTLSTSNWSGSSAPFTQTVTVNGILADTTQQAINIAPTATTANIEVVSTAGVYATAQGDNSITFSATNSKPTENVSFIIQFQKAITI